MNIVDRVKKADQATAVKLLREVCYAASREDAEKQKRAFQLWCKEKGYEKAAGLIDEDWARMVAFFDFPKEHWQHLRTTNPVTKPARSRGKGRRLMNHVYTATHCLTRKGNHEYNRCLTRDVTL